MTHHIYASDRLEIYARASHALRTQVSIMLLEIGAMRGQEARRVENDVIALGEAIRKSFLLLGLYSGQTPMMTTFDVSRLSEEILDWFQDCNASKRLRIDRRSGAAIQFTGYLEGIREAVFGLIDNALKYTPDEGSISVRFDANLSITVEDRGPEVLLPRGFETPAPFLGGGFDGSGLGLGWSIAEAVAKLHKGQLSIAQVEGGGLKAVLELVPCEK